MEPINSAMKPPRPMPVNENLEWDGNIKFGILPQWSTPVLAPASLTTLTLDQAIEHELKHGRKLDPNMDPKRLRRTISNRLSAQRSRIRIVHYIHVMEKIVKDLQESISFVKSQIESHKEKQKSLVVQNDNLQQEVEICANEIKLRQTKLEAQKLELQNLKELEKNMQKRQHGYSTGLQPLPDYSFNQPNLEQIQSFGFHQYGHVQQLPISGFDPFYQQQCPSSSGLVQSSHINLQRSSAGPSGTKQLLSSDINGSSQQPTSELNQEQADIDQARERRLELGMPPELVVAAVLRSRFVVTGDWGSEPQLLAAAFSVGEESRGLAGGGCVFLLELGVESWNRRGEKCRDYG
ncbi:uncharacterized protein Fot_17702 [Forsythia ovata]|uniref:BZIP domain-containing protein n=1 Tax=Forsythia ovata TaxID=205694 RepID=A0ABD1VG40_9LAMI